MELLKFAHRIILLLVLLPTAAGAQQVYKVKKMDFCTNAFEFSTLPVPGGLVFCSDRLNDSLNTVTGVAENLTDFYFIAEGSTEPVLYDTALVSRYHDGPASLSADGKTLWFSRNIEEFADPSNPDEDLVIGLFSAQWQNGHWTNIQPFPYNNREYSLACPSLSVDGKSLYFTSDMAEGNGGSDLYVSRNEAGQWSKPENLGPVVNSEASETFAFIHPSGRLYFASNGHNSSGGLDIFFSDFTEQGWTQPEAMPSPINSSDDDFAFYADPEGAHGYLSSNRGKGIDNIYSFELNLPTFKGCEVQQEVSTCVTFIEKRTADLENTTLEYRWDLGDGTSADGVNVQHCYDGPGTYQVSLSVYDTLIRKEMGVVDTFTYTITAKEGLSMTTNAEGKSMTFNAVDGTKTTPEIVDFYWDFGDGNQGSGRKVTHQYEKAGEYEVLLGVFFRSAKGKLEKECVVKTVVVE